MDLHVVECHGSQRMDPADVVDPSGLSDACFQVVRPFHVVQLNSQIHFDFTNTSENEKLTDTLREFPQIWYKR